MNLRKLCSIALCLQHYLQLMSVALYLSIIRRRVEGMEGIEEIIGERERERIVKRRGSRERRGKREDKEDR